MPRKMNSRFQDITPVIGSFAVAAVLLTLFFTFHAYWNLDSLANLLGVIAFFIPVVTSTYRWLARSRNANIDIRSRQENIPQAKKILADLVEAQWRDEAHRRLLNDPAPIPIMWSITSNDRVMDHPSNLPPMKSKVIGTSDPVVSIANKFRAMERRRMVIVGGPGSGKTTLAVQLLLELIEPGNVAEPVPLLLTLAGWDTEKFPRLRDWLAERLAQDYPALRTPALGPNMTTLIAEGRHILLILDGLDELPVPARADVITLLNRSLDNEDQLILTCRTAEFGQAVHAAGDVVTSALVVEPDPLTSAEAADYLTRCIPPLFMRMWEPVLTALRESRVSEPSEPLAEIVSTPLGLWLVRTAYIAPGRNPSELLDPVLFPDPRSLRAYLFDQLIPAACRQALTSDSTGLSSRSARRWYQPDHVRRWLGFLAYHLSCGSNRSTRDFSWWLLARTTRAITNKMAIGLGIVAGILFGGAAGLLAGLVFSVTVGWGVTIIVSIPVMIGSGLWGLSWPNDPPVYATFRLRNLRLLDLHNLVQGVMIGAIGGVLGWLAFTIHHLPWVGLGLGVLLGLGNVCIDLIEVPTSKEAAITPMSSWRSDRTVNNIHTLISLVVIGIPGGILTGFAGARKFGLAGGIFFGIIGFLGFGLLVGLVFGIGVAIALRGQVGRHQAWPAYIVATYRLWGQKRLPRRLMPFLDAVYRAGLLRAVGPIYQFRHAEFQDRLAATFEEKGVHPSSRTSRLAAVTPQRREPPASSATQLQT